MTCLGVLDIEEIRDNDNDTGLKEGGGIEMSNYSAFHIRECTALFRFLHFTYLDISTTPSKSPFPVVMVQLLNFSSKLRMLLPFGPINKPMSFELFNSNKTRFNTSFFNSLRCDPCSFIFCKMESRAVK